MCGIFGYKGKADNAADMVLKGLKLLEYRGYDSWGIAVKNKEKLVIDKHIGKIGNAATELPKSSIGIGHTRWATHGGVTSENAHPHLDCTLEIALIHNGIVENYLEIKKELLKKHHHFLSETDTEVISHLIEENLKKNDFVLSVRQAFNRLTGLNAIVVLNSLTDEIIACKTGSPLVVGQKNDEYFLASDATGIMEHTKNILFLKDREMIILSKSLRLINLETGRNLPLHFETINWKMENTQKGNFPHFMLKEIYEQPKVVANIAKNYSDQAIALADAIKQAKGTFFIAAGTAFNACLGGVYFFSKIAGIHVNTALASEFNYLEDFLTRHSLVIALSQSGETIDVIEPLNRALRKRSKVIGIVNTLGSTIYRMADLKILLGAGPEIAVASTKAYSAKLSILFLIAHALEKKTATGSELLLQAAAEIKRLLEKKSLVNLQNIATFLAKTEHIYIIGRGASYASALEAALKIKEVSYIHTEGLAGGELKHGTIALITQNTPCIVFTPDDETYAAMISNAAEIKARGGIIIGIGPKKESIFDYWIQVKNIGGASIIAQIIPPQLLAYYLAVKKGLDPDKPRNLAKSVTVR